MKKRMTLVLLLLGSVMWSGAALYGQSNERGNAAEVDHMTVYVRDLQKSADFYRKVFGLEEIAEPFKDGKHVWFRMGPHQQLHVVGGATEPARHTIDVHLAFRVASLKEFMKHLDEMQIKYRDFKGEKNGPTARPDGVQQIYFQDPDGYWIEVNDDRF